jgi:hypothetical protein
MSLTTENMAHGGRGILGALLGGGSSKGGGGGGGVGAGARAPDMGRLRREVRDLGTLTDADGVTAVASDESLRHFDCTIKGTHRPTPHAAHPSPPPALTPHRRPGR